MIVLRGENEIGKSGRMCDSQNEIVRGVCFMLHKIYNRNIVRMIKHIHFKDKPILNCYIHIIYILIHYSNYYYYYIL